MRRSASPGEEGADSCRHSFFSTSRGAHRWVKCACAAGACVTLYQQSLASCVTSLSRPVSGASVTRLAEVADHRPDETDPQPARVRAGEAGGESRFEGGRLRRLGGRLDGRLPLYRVGDAPAGGCDVLLGHATRPCQPVEVCLPQGVRDRISKLLARRRERRERLDIEPCADADEQLRRETQERWRGRRRKRRRRRSRGRSCASVGGRSRQCSELDPL